MIIYLFPYVTLLLTKLYSFRKEKISKLCYIISFLPIYLLYVLRSTSVGFDTNQYAIQFFNITKQNWNEIIFNNLKAEPGIYIVYKFLSYFTQNFNVVLCVLGLICFVPVLYFFYKNTKNLILALILFYCYNFFLYLTSLRQCCAMSICLLSIEFIKKKKIVFAFLIILIAVFFHHSAYVFFLLLLCPLMKKFAGNIKFWIFIAISIFIFFIPLYTYFAKMLFYENYEILQLNNGYIYMSIAMFLCLICFIYSKEIYKMNDYMHIFYFMIGLYIICWIGRQFVWSFSRLLMYFSYGLFVVLSEFTSIKINTKIKNFIVILLYLIPLIILLNNMRNYSADFTYTFFFE